MLLESSSRSVLFSFPNQMSHNLALMRMLAMFKQVHTLPSAKGKTSLMDRYAQRNISKYGSDVCGHVIGSFLGVLDPGGSFWNQTFEKGVQVTQDIWIRIFLDRQAGRSVTTKERQQTGLNGCVL